MVENIQTFQTFRVFLFRLVFLVDWSFFSFPFLASAGAIIRAGCYLYWLNSFVDTVTNREELKGGWIWMWRSKWMNAITYSIVFITLYIVFFTLLLHHSKMWASSPPFHILHPIGYLFTCSSRKGNQISLLQWVYELPQRDNNRIDRIKPQLL